MAKKNEQEKIRCMECERAALVQWDNNPVIAHCRNYSYGNVANTLRHCHDFKPSTKRPKIMKMTHFK